MAIPREKGQFVQPGTPQIIPRIAGSFLSIDGFVDFYYRKITLFYLQYGVLLIMNQQIMILRNLELLKHRIGNCQSLLVGIING